MKYTVNAKFELETDHKIDLSFKTNRIHGAVDVVGTTPAGDIWLLVTFHEDGRIQLHSGVPRDIGFDMQANGKIKLRGY